MTLQDRLPAVLSPVLGTGVAIVNLRALTGGASRGQALRELDTFRQAVTGGPAVTLATLKPSDTTDSLISRIVEEPPKPA